ncbi:MAG: HAMP domain-containing histidine kinase [Deltaproteobacteria bacterium]|nr:HAMP domain-containing histidine kinase [Deltaproteobacteria bacterium]
MRELFKGLVENATVGMIAFEESEGRYVAVFSNYRALEILERKDGSGWDCHLLFPQSGRGNIAPFSPELASREGLHPEVLMAKATGSAFVASAAIRRINDGGKTLLLLSFQDITVEWKLSRDLTAKQEEIARAYTELLEQNQQLKTLDQAKDKFIALTTHELRTPLSAILATADFLENKLYDTDEQRDEFIRTISEQGRHLMELVNDVLDFAKIRAGKMDFYVEEVTLDSLLTKIVSNFQHMADQSKVSLVFEHTSGSVKAWADLVRLKEIINNVISNAIKYNREKGNVRIHLTDFADESRRFVRMVVTDTGVGIPADKLEGVFNEFETVGHVSKHHKGTGLGMPISRRLVESMGGRLTLKSEYGVGSEFYIDIPVDKVLDESMYRVRPSLDSDLVAS